MLPQGLAADHPGGGAEGIGQGEQQRDLRASPPPQQYEEERHGARRQERSGELLHDPRHVVEAGVPPTMLVQVANCGKVEGGDDDRQHHGVERDDAPVGPTEQPVRLIALSLRRDLRDLIEIEGVVLQDREGQITRRIGVAGTDRPQVRVVDEQAKHADQEARSQSASGHSGLGIGRRRRPPLRGARGARRIDADCRCHPCSSCRVAGCSPRLQPGT